MRTKLVLSLLLLFCGVARTASAQLVFSLNPAGLDGAPGSSVTFNGTLSNVGSDIIWLNGDASGASAPGLTIDDTPYFNNFPLFLEGGDSATADLFTVDIDPGVPAGTYDGFFTIVGGADESAQDTLATQNFQVQIGSTPEPGSIALLAGAGIAGMFALRKAAPQKTNSKARYVAPSRVRGKGRRNRTNGNGCRMGSALQRWPCSSTLVSRAGLLNDF